MVTTKHVDLSVEHFLDILMLYGLNGQDEAPFSVYIQGCPFLRAARQDCYSERLSV